MKSKTVVVVILMTLVLSSILEGASLAKNIENDSLRTLTNEINCFGNGFTRIEGEWEYYPNSWAIRMSPGSGYCWAEWDINLGVPVIQDGTLQIGLDFCDRAGYPWVNGPDLSIYNWDTSSYYSWEGVGNWDEFSQIWKTPPGDQNAYVNREGRVRIRVYAHPDCDTIVHMVSVKYQEIPGKPKIQASPTDFTWKKVKTESTVEFNFTVTNIGDNTSYLDWYIQNPQPMFGTWSFTPRSGENLPSGSSVTVNAVVILPEDTFKWNRNVYSCDIGVLNPHDLADGVFIEVQIATRMGLSLTMDDHPFAHFFHGKFANYLEFMQNLIHNK